LYLNGCTSLKGLPSEIGKLVALKFLNLNGCTSLEDLPSEIGNLVGLKTLYLNGCTSLRGVPREWLYKLRGRAKRLVS
jgi:Leucine-rich repeat (LRR) protein